MTHLTFPIRSDKLTMTVAVTDHIVSFQSEFQQIDILETTEFGRILLLDNHIQLATRDEHAYHEALVHIPLLNLKNPQSALVVGGGDGGVIRELCKNPDLKTIHMVDIDQSVVDLCKEHLPTLNNGAYQDPRVKLFIEDAFAFVKNTDQSYDLIVVDATDTYEDEEGELSESLFTQEFYKDCRNRLTQQGVVVTQADNLVFCPYSIEEIITDFTAAFGFASSYWCLVPSFGGYSGFAYASPNTRLATTWQSLPQPPQQQFQYLNPTTYDLAFKPTPF